MNNIMMRTSISHSLLLRSLSNTVLLAETSSCPSISTLALANKKNNFVKHIHIHVHNYLKNCTRMFVTTANQRLCKNHFPLGGPSCHRFVKESKRSSVFSRGFTTEQSNEQTGNRKMPLWQRFAIVGTVASLFGYSYYTLYRQREIKNEEIRYQEFQKAELGGDWTLIDQEGKKRSSTEFRGQWILLYFGFTHCPDICPEELEKLVGIVKHFETDPKLPNMKPIFITLDPERDNPTAIKEYLADFKCPNMEGFTAPTVEAIKEVATKYRAYFSKGIPDEDNDYIVDHTIIIYVVSPEGKFVNYFDRGRSANEIITTVSDHVSKYNALKQGR